MRIIGLDVGTKTVGVALSDPLGITAQPFETITRKENNKLRRTYARIEQIISEYDVTEIVVGYPKNMDDTIGERAKACEEFAAALERRTGLPVTLWDERLTTVEADEILEECGMRRENRKISLRLFLFCVDIWNLNRSNIWRICFSWKSLNLLTRTVRRHNFM